MIVSVKAINARKTSVSIVGDEFHINGRPTYAGRVWGGHRIQGRLLNSRMVQGIFDDRNPETVKNWAYPDTGKWDPERNTREFIDAMPEWRRRGLLVFTINLQGGSPQGYSKDQRMRGEGFDAGYQGVPVNWGISSERKRGFFELLSKITGANSSEPQPP